jgi:hypothetical protein
MAAPSGSPVQLPAIAKVEMEQFRRVAAATGNEETKEVAENKVKEIPKKKVKEVPKKEAAVEKVEAPSAEEIRHMLAGAHEAIEAWKRANLLPRQAQPSDHSHGQGKVEDVKKDIDVEMEKLEAELQEIAISGKEEKSRDKEGKKEKADLDDMKENIPIDNKIGQKETIVATNRLGPDLAKEPRPMLAKTLGRVLCEGPRPMLAKTLGRADINRMKTELDKELMEKVLDRKDDVEDNVKKFLEDLVVRKEQELRCSVCREVAAGPAVFCCRQAHTVCQACRVKTGRCGR